MKIILCDYSKTMVDAWIRWLYGCPDVLIHIGNILRFKADAIVSPANSWGCMDGGIDRAYCRHFPPGLEVRVREAIKRERRGSLSIGDALAIKTGDIKIPNLICAPTMQEPSDVAQTQNAMHAFSAALRVAEVSGFTSILCPGLCTGIGGMDPENAAYQMMQGRWEVKQYAVRV